MGCFPGVWWLTAGAGYETCISQDQSGTNALVNIGILKRMPCPPGVGGQCFGAGPNISKVTAGSAGDSGPCRSAVYPAYDCKSGPDSPDLVCTMGTMLS